MDIVGLLIGLALFGMLYMFPTGIAIIRKHRNVVPIGILNLFLGWSFFGWFAALIWAFTYQNKDSL